MYSNKRSSISTYSEERQQRTGLHFLTLDAIKIEEKERVKLCTMKMLVAWLKKTDNVSC